MMWPLVGKFLRRSTTSYPHSFFTTFKDVQTLCKEEEEEENGHRNPHRLQQRHQEEKQLQITHMTRSKSAAAVFHQVGITSTILRAWTSLLPRPPEANRIVVYFTSLRVVRKTFSDCRTVLSILQGFRISVDERDLSMDAGFLVELRALLGQEDIALPRVFFGGRYVGGADEVVFLHETGELKKILQGFPTANVAGCSGCRGVRFVLWFDCYGSRKVFLEECGFGTCFVCNENGLIRCPSCCS